MRRVFGSLVCALVIAAIPALAAAQDKKAAPKAVSATGAVTAVSASSLTVKGKDAEWTFAVDKDTKVVAKGGTTKATENKAAGKGTEITDVVHVGDTVTVSYHDMGATKHAANVRVVTQAPPAAKKK